MTDDATAGLPASTRPTGLVSRLNDALARRITIAVSSMWAFYVFVIFGLTPLVWPQYETQILYWSNFLQLVFLPVITVGSVVMSRGSDAQRAKDHRRIRKELTILKDTHQQLGQGLNDIRTRIDRLLDQQQSKA